MGIWAIVFVLLILLLVVLACIYVVKAYYNKVSTGEEGLIGKYALAETTINREKGKVFVNGEYWNAVSSKNISKGKKVIILKILDNLVLKVKEA